MSENPYEPMSKEQKDAIVQGNGLTYTHEQMRQVQHAIAAGKNPLVALENVPRWEDMAGVDRIINRRVLELDPLPTPAQVLAELPLTRQMQDIVAYSRDEVRACLYGQDDRLLVIVGPCSVHDPKAALDYAHRLRTLKDELGEDLLIVMRVYFEKPRTTVGWKGLINDPDIDGSHNIQKGLLLARRTLLDVLGAGVATATEFLEPTSPQYIADAVSWGAIGARNTESQVHRQLASGMSMPIGFKNATDGSVKAAVNSCIAAEDQHTFFGIDHRGRACAVETLGNPDCHVVLRGSSSGPNYDGRRGGRLAWARHRLLAWQLRQGRRAAGAGGARDCRTHRRRGAGHQRCDDGEFHRGRQSGAGTARRTHLRPVDHRQVPELAGHRRAAAHARRCRAHPPLEPLTQPPAFQPRSIFR